MRCSLLLITICVLASCVCLAQAKLSLENIEEQFSAYEKKYSRVYSSEAERSIRMENFQQSIQRGMKKKSKSFR